MMQGGNKMKVNLKNMNQGDILLAAIIVVALALLPPYLLGFAGGSKGALAGWLYLIPPAIAVVCGIAAAEAFGKGNPSGGALRLIMLGLLCWFIGDFIFFAFEQYLHTDPFPSIADVFYLVAYPLLFIGLYRYAKLSDIEWTPARKMLAWIAGLLLAAIVFYFGIYLAFDPEAPLLDNLIAMSYGVGDLFLIIAALVVAVMASEFRGGLLFRYWNYFTAGMFLMLAADILFAIYPTQYVAGEWPFRQMDLLWSASYLLFAWALFGIGFAIKKAETRLLEKLTGMKSEAKGRGRR